MHRPLPLLALLLAGCPESPSGSPGQPGAPGRPGGPGGSGGAPGQGSGPVATQVDFTAEPGQAVTISGSVAYAGQKSGKIRIDFLQVEQGQPPKLARMIEPQAMGDWSIEAPRDFGEIRIVGFLDVAGDGPGTEDPAMIWPQPVRIGSEPITGIALVLSDTPDLGDLTPGRNLAPGPQAGGGEGGPPPGGPGGAGGAGGPPTGGQGAGAAPPAPGGGAR